MRPTALLLLAIAPAACAGDPTADLDFPDWRFPVSEGIPIKEYAPVSLEERAGKTIELVEDLVIGGDPNDPNTAFYQPMGVVADDDGKIFVLELGNKRVQVFGPDGQYVRTLGGEGQGPGEFELPFALTIAGDRLIVNDPNNGRFSVFTLDGEHVADLPQRDRPTSGFEWSPSFQRRVPDLEVDDLKWPERDFAISSISTDGDGRLYVFPRIELPENDPTGMRPVDVYSADGELLFAGMVADTWRYARGDYVYTFRTDGDLGENVLVRYRLEPPDE